ncbi:hypothetical protein Tco_0270672 [Tanacetum coccineum]
MSNSLDFRAPPPSPVGPGRRSTVANDDILTDFLHQTLIVPDLVLPGRVFPRQNPNIQSLPKLGFKKLNFSDDFKLEEVLIEVIAQKGYFELVNHGISNKLLWAIKERDKVYWIMLVGLALIQLEMYEPIGGTHHYNICLFPQRQIRGIPGDLSLGIGFPGDLSPGIYRAEKLEGDTFPGDLPGRHRGAHTVSVKQIFATMTTSVVNNSVLKGFFEKQKLTGPNFIDWYRQLRIVLSVEDKLDYLEQPVPPAPVLAQAGQQVAPEALAAHAAWELKTLFPQQAEQELLQTVRDFHSCKQEEGQSISSYVLKMKSYIDNLERLGHLVSLNLRVSLILISLGKEFDSFVQNYNMHGIGKTVNELHAMLKLHEQTLTKKDHALHAIQAGKVQKKNNKQKKPQLAARGQNQGKGKNKLTYAPKPKIPSPPKRENPAKDSICCQYDDTGHCCGTHICNTTQGLRGSRKLKLGALSLYVGNGQRAAVEVIGSYHLCLLSGLVIVLNNCHYALSITRGIILVSRLYDDGFVNRFVDNAISVSRNNLVYFSVVPRVH